jgi:hypothetical protein
MIPKFQTPNTNHPLQNQSDEFIEVEVGSELSVNNILMYEGCVADRFYDRLCWYNSEELTERK